jgi:hypothetical protein
MTPEGGFVTESLGYNPYMDGQALFKDAIRVYWRLATDYMWSQVRGAGGLIGWGVYGFCGVWGGEVDSGCGCDIFLLGQ